MRVPDKGHYPTGPVAAQSDDTVTNRVQPSEDIDCVALAKGRERYILLFTAANRSAALRTIGRWASNPELNFTWYDAARLTQKIREQSAT